MFHNREKKDGLSSTLSSRFYDKMFNSSRIPQINPSFQKSKIKNIESNKDNTEQIILVEVYYQMLTNILNGYTRTLLFTVICGIWVSAYFSDRVT